jgi:hypothetical protein
VAFLRAATYWEGEAVRGNSVMNASEFKVPQDSKNAKGPKNSVIGRNSFMALNIRHDALQKKRQKAPESAIFLGGKNRLDLLPLCATF